MSDNCIPEATCEQLCIIDTSIRYLIVVIAAVLLSFYAVLIQRKQLLCTVVQDDCCENLPDVFPIRLVSGAMLIAALLYFFGLAKDTVCKPQENVVAENSSQANYTASLLVLIAAVIRFRDLIYVESCSPPAQALADLDAEVA